MTPFHLKTLSEILFFEGFAILFVVLSLTVTNDDSYWLDIETYVILFDCFQCCLFLLTTLMLPSLSSLIDFLVLSEFIVIILFSCLNPLTTDFFGCLMKKSVLRYVISNLTVLTFSAPCFKTNNSKNFGLCRCCN